MIADSTMTVIWTDYDKVLDLFYCLQSQDSGCEDMMATVNTRDMVSTGHTK